MKQAKLIFISGFILLARTISAQDSLVVNIDILKEIQSPASNLIGISNTEISKPSDPTAFMASIRQATNNFSELPSNYAIDIAPAWLFNAKNIKAENFLSAKPKYSIPQTFVISTAVNNDHIMTAPNQVSENIALGLGIKFSIFRGAISEETNRAIASSIDLAKQRGREFSDIAQELQLNSQEFQDILNELQRDDLNETEIKILQLRGELELERINGIAADKLEHWNEEFKQISNRIDLTRTKFKLDFNAAISYNFENQIFSNGKADKIAAWLTGGYEWNSGLSLLGIVRYLHNPDARFLNDLDIVEVKNLNMINGGLKIQYEKNKFAISSEFLSQNVTNNDTIESGVKFLINTEYRVAPNMKLSMTFGKDFTGMITKEGNVISALNFLMGFGSKRRIAD